MDVFQLRDCVVDEYAGYIRSFVTIQDDRIREKVESGMAGGLLWPEPPKHEISYIGGPTSRGTTRV